ncbi:MAG: hypothetical protein WAO98_09815 [Alphaproteobacteria bacterium]
MDIRKILLLAVGSAVLTACAATGPSFQLRSSDKPQIVIYRTNHTVGFGASYWVEINGQQVCDLHNSSFMIYAAQPGENIITSSAFGRVGTAKLTLNLRSKEVVYVRMEQTGVTGAMLFGVIGDAIENDAGPVKLEIVSKNVAEEGMKEMGQDCL